MRAAINTGLQSAKVCSSSLPTRFTILFRSRAGHLLQPPPSRYRMTNPAEAAAKLDPAPQPVDASKNTRVIIQYLKDQNLSFFHTSHPIAYTAQQAAAEAHVPGNEFGKAVMVQLDDRETVMCVLRAPDRVKLAPFAKAINASKAELCSDEKIREMSEHVEGMESGALPPLPLFGVRMFMDAELAKAQLIHFCAGSHHEIITMYMQDYVKTAKPTIMAFAEPLDIHVRELTKLLQKFNLGMPHGILRHKPAYTASEAAKETSVPGAAMVKSGVVFVGGYHERMLRVSTWTRGQSYHHFEQAHDLYLYVLVELANEEELKEHFHGVEVGAIPPFGCLFNVPLYVDEGVGSWPIKGDGDVIFNAGTHTESMIMRYADYLKVNKKWNEPVIGKFAHLDTGAGHPWTSSHIKRYLHDQEIGFTSVMHSVAYTAHEIAHAAGISGNFLAKTVMVKVEGKLAMAVLRAADFLDLDKLSQLTGGKSVALAEEPEFANTFVHVEPGAMPPFGHIYNMPTYVDIKLAGMDHLYMNAGTHKELLCLKWSDYDRLVGPVIGELARVPAPSTPAPTPTSGTQSPQPAEATKAKPDTVPNSAEVQMPQPAPTAATADATVSVTTPPVVSKHADPEVAKAADQPPTSHAT